MLPIPMRGRGEFDSVTLSVAAIARRRDRAAVLIATGLLASCGWSIAAGPVAIHSQDVVVLVALGAIALLACSGEVVLARSMRAGELSDRSRLDASGVIAIVSLWLAGPAVGVLAIAAPELLLRWRGPGRVRLPSRLANLASYAAACVVGSLVLAALGHSHPGSPAGGLSALLLGGLVWFLVNYAVARGIGGLVIAGLRPVAMIRGELVPALPSVAAMVACAAATALLVSAVGAPGLAPLALAVLAPQLALAVLALISPRAGELEIEAGRVRYAGALCRQLELSRRERQVVLAAARGEVGVRRLSAHTADIWYAVGAARFYERERYDGRGSLGLAGALIPIESRVLAVADAWAKLTARGTLAMTQDAAVASLERHQPRFDPHVIEAARELTIRDAEIRRVPPASRAGRRLALLVGAR